MVNSPAPGDVKKHQIAWIDLRWHCDCHLWPLPGRSLWDVDSNLGIRPRDQPRAVKALRPLRTPHIRLTDLVERQLHHPVTAWRCGHSYHWHRHAPGVLTRPIREHSRIAAWCCAWRFPDRIAPLHGDRVFADGLEIWIARHRGSARHN